MKLKKIENQKTFIVYVLETAYPAACSGDQKNLVLINMRRNETSIPVIIAATAE